MCSRSGPWTCEQDQLCGPSGANSLVTKTRSPFRPKSLVLTLTLQNNATLRDPLTQTGDVEGASLSSAHATTPHPTSPRPLVIVSAVLDPHPDGFAASHEPGRVAGQRTPPDTHFSLPSTLLHHSSPSQCGHRSLLGSVFSRSRVKACSGAAGDTWPAASSGSSGSWRPLRRLAS